MKVWDDRRNFPAPPPPPLQIPKMPRVQPLVTKIFLKIVVVKPVSRKFNVNF